MAQTVGLTDAEGKAFWPVYDACQVELDGINKRLKAGIEGYAKDYNAGTHDRREGSGDADRDVRHRRGPAGVEEVLRRQAERRDPGHEDRALRAGREQDPRPDQLRAGRRHPVRAVASRPAQDEPDSTPGVVIVSISV
ncbi:MAG: hypothetical protein MZV64_04740 [Ignavibacteriales bacterium]|nr:hypothetical protein [Ignavibacteriales bacterium]